MTILLVYCRKLCMDKENLQEALTLRANHHKWLPCQWVLLLWIHSEPRWLMHCPPMRAANISTFEFPLQNLTWKIHLIVSPAFPHTSSGCQRAILNSHICKETSNIVTGLSYLSVSLLTNAICCPISLSNKKARRWAGSYGFISL